jgi:hypothetical protein
MHAPSDVFSHTSPSWLKPLKLENLVHTHDAQAVESSGFGLATVLLSISLLLTGLDREIATGSTGTSDEYTSTSATAK